MKRVSATRAAQRFSELVDAAKGGGERLLNLGRGHAIERIEPARAADGKSVKEFLRSNAPDGDWADERGELRGKLASEERPW